MIISFSTLLLVRTESGGSAVPLVGTCRGTRWFHYIGRHPLAVRVGSPSVAER